MKFINETKAEMKHVSWPTRKQTLFFTLLVVVVSAITAILLGAFDSFFTYIVDSIV